MHTVPMGRGIFIIYIVLLFHICCSCSSREGKSEVRELPEVLLSYDNYKASNIDSLHQYIPKLLQLKCDSPAYAFDVDWRLAWYYNSRQAPLDSALKYSTLAIEDYKTYDKTDAKVGHQMAELKLLKAYWMYTRHGDLRDSAYVLLNECVHDFATYGDTRRLITSWLYKADILRRKYDFKECLEILYHIQTITDTAIFSTNDYSWALQTLSSVADMATDVTDYQTSGNNLGLAANYFDQSNEFSQLIYLSARARMCLYNGEYNNSLYYSERMERLASETINYDMLHFAYALEGVAHLRLHQYTTAEEIYSMNKKLIAAHRNNIYISNEGIALDGEIAALQHRMKEAYKLLFDSLENRSFRFDYFNMLESRKTYYIVQNDYKSVYNLQQSQKQYSDSIKSSVIFPKASVRVENDKYRYYALSTSLHSLRDEYEAVNKQIVVERVIFIAILVICVALFLSQKRINSATNNKKIKEELERLRNENKINIAEIERSRALQLDTNKRITESIMYAEHIQHSILPPPNKLNEYPIAGSFIFYNPLDVVSGDFYWFTQKGDWLYVACADCTGHGVPAAFMSMIAAISLDNILNFSKKFLDPSEVLEMLDAKIKEHLYRNVDEGSTAPREGLDIALVAINVETKRVRVSAARRPIIIIRDQNIVTFSGTRRSIGDVDELLCERKFVTEEFKMHADDCIYMYSDGYNDQIGGKDGVKLNHAKIKHFIRAIHDDDMDEQGLTIQELFTQWKADYPQVDDVLFIGIKL